MDEIDGLWSWDVSILKHVNERDMVTWNDSDDIVAVIHWRLSN